MSGDQLFSHPVQPADTDERYTPRWIFDAMGVMFDLDPAAPVGGGDHVPARSRYTADDDGLARPWDGLVWLNPPFSNPAPWVARWVAHGNGVLLFPWSVNANWRWKLLRAVSMLVTLEHVRFDHPTHTGRHVPVGCALTALGDGIEPALRVADLSEQSYVWNRW